MARKTSMGRANPFPRAALARRQHVALLDFFEMVGDASYGVDWKRDFVSKLPPQGERPPLRSDAALALAVRDQILLALQEGTINAAVPIQLEASELNSPPRPLSVDDEDDINILKDLDIIDDAELEQKAESGVVTCYIAKGSWLFGETLVKVNWKRSLCDVKPACLRLPKRMGKWDEGTPLSIIRPGSEMIFDVPLWIMNPDAAIRNMYPFEALPDENWRRRYSIYREDMLLELVAAAWRNIAVAPPESHDVQGADLVRAMQNYLTSQGIDERRGEWPGLSTLQAVAAKIVRQWKSKNLTSSVLVGSRSGIKDPGVKDPDIKP